MSEPGEEPLSVHSHERFALLLAQGEVSAAEAYRQEVSKRASKATVETEGPALARSPQVSLRIAWLKRQVDQKAKEKAQNTVLSMLEKREFLARVVRVKGAAIDEDKDADLINGVRYDKDGRAMLLLPDKIAAIKLDNDLAGEGSEAKGQDAMVALLGRLRQ